MRVEPVLGRPSRVPERGLLFLDESEPAVTGASAAAIIIPIEMKAWISSSWRWNYNIKNYVKQRSKQQLFQIKATII